MLPAACGRVVTTIAWRRMLRPFRAGGDDDCVGGGCSSGFAAGGDDDYLEEDAPGPLGPGGDDDYLEDDAPRGSPRGGEDDCVGGGCLPSLLGMVTTITLEGGPL